MYFLLIALVALAAGTGAGYFSQNFLSRKREEGAAAKAAIVLEDAKSEAKDILLSAKDKAVHALSEIKKEEQLRRRQLDKMEERLERTESGLSRKEQEVHREWDNVKLKAQDIEKIKEEVRSLRQEELERLKKITKLSPQKAKELLFKSVEKEYAEDVKEQIANLEKNKKESLDEKAREIMTLAIQRYAAGHVVDHSTSTVSIGSDELKGRIIGREGRNINAIERLTGAEIIVDDTPQAIVVSAFDPIRREIAKQALERLVEDGRIHPARIEETIKEVKQDINKRITEAGEAAMFEVGVTGLDPRLVKLLGRLRYRTSYGQNILLHSIEVSHLAGALAAELGLDMNLAKKAGLLHDIGKAIDREVQGTHVEIGINVLKKFGLSERVIDAMKSHHGDYPHSSPEATLVASADAISAARPGARRDSVENYLKRIEEIEDIAKTFDEVDKAYAIQAGRELRVFVSPEKISDLESVKLARDIAGKIEENLKYPGEIKVVIIRETRVTEYAR
jgi:ribonucrease Y